MSASIRIVVGEADYLEREGLVRALEAVDGMDVVSICSTLEALRAAAKLEEPDVLLMSLTLPRSRTATVIELVEELRKSHPKIGVVLLGDQSDFALALPLFDKGVVRSGFILRRRIQNSGELTHAIREIARGNSVVDPAAVGTLLTAARRRAETPFSTLSAREREVLRLIADAESNSAIARELGITTRAVERHVNSIFRKLDLGGSSDVNPRVKAALAFAGNAEVASEGPS